MIPICRAPKRFVCALGRARRHPPAAKGLLMDFKFQNRTIVAVKNCHQIGIASSFSSAVPLQLDYDELEMQTAADVKKPISYPGKAVNMEQSNLALVGGRNAFWWTGKNPSVCPGIENGRLYSLPQLSLEAGMSRETIQAYFDNTWTLTEILLAGLEGEDAFSQPPYHELRHPMIFYYGHPAALYINKLRVAGLLKDAINPYFEVIFETGVDEMSWDDLSKNKMSWPSVAEVHSYRKKVYEAVSAVISNISDEDCAKGIDKESSLWALVMAFEHERIHLETSSVLISEMPVHLTRFPEGLPDYHKSIKKSKAEVVRAPVAGIHYPSQEMIPVESQIIHLGKPSDFPSFGW
jgi:DinB superfamily